MKKKDLDSNLEMHMLIIGPSMPLQQLACQSVIFLVDEEEEQHNVKDVLMEEEITSIEHMLIEHNHMNEG